MTGRFDDRLTSPLPGLRDLLRILRTGGFRPKDAARDARHVPRAGPAAPAGASAAGAAGSGAPSRGAALPGLREGEASLTWVGHATFLVRMAGKTVLTDPVWSPRLPGRIPRLVPPGIAWQDLPPIDAVVVSHNHYDHLDAATLKRLPRTTPIHVGLGGGRWFRGRGFAAVTELDWWQTAELDSLRITFVPAHHWSRRGPFDTNDSLWGGFVLDAGVRKAYFAGDTGYGHWFKEIGTRHPGIEVAMLPIGAYDPAWFMRPVHMDPSEAMRALTDLKAHHLAAMHWGTFPLTREPILEPLERIRSGWPSDRLRSDLWDLAIGETRVWGSPPMVAPLPASRKRR